MTHYQTLGIEPDASADDVKKAYRVAASAAHPDREGGNAGRMAAVNAAYETLGDAERRARYDQTGSDKAPESPEQKARELLMQLFNQAIAQDSQNFVRDVRDTIEHQRAGWIAMKVTLTLKSAKLAKRRDRVKVKDGENLLHMVIDQQARMADSQVQQIVEQLKVAGLSLGMLEKYEEEQEPAVVMPTFYFNNGWTNR